MIYAILGSREFSDLSLIDSFVRRLPQDATVISGGAKGADTQAEKAAKKRGIVCEVIPADWNRHGQKAGAIRNAEMIRRAEKVVVFWDEQSRGAKDAIDRTRKAKKPLLIVYQNGDMRREEPATQATLWD